MGDAAGGPQHPARGPFACRLALKLVDEALGPVCRQVIASLIDHGMQQYGEMLRTCGLPAGQLRSALVVLVQHNYVSCYLREEPPTLRGPGPSYHLYEAALPRILQILRVPRFLTHIADEHGQESVRLVHNLLEHGRLRWDQLLKAVCSEAAEEGGGEGEEEAPPDPGVLANQFRSLVMERFVERVPPCNLPPPAQQVHPNARKKKAAPKPGSEEEANLHREQAEAAQRQVYQEVRFQLSDDLGGDSAVDPAAAALKAGDKRKRGEAAPEEPKKKRGRRKAEAAAAAEAAAEASAAAGAGGSTAAGGGKEPVLWRVNYDEFNRRFRNEVLSNMVKAKYGAPAGQAVMGLLLANARFEQTAHTAETVVLSVSDVSGALRRAHGPAGMPENLGAVLSELSEDTFEFLEDRGHGPGGAQYVLLVPMLVRLAQLNEVQAIVKSKFGGSGLRIWNLLIRGQLEQKQVADMAMLTKEESREKLYSMMRLGYLQLQDVPRTTDHAPSRTFYTWRAHLPTIASRVAGDLYRAAGNLHARQCHELGKQSELLQLLEQPSMASHVLERRETEIHALRAVTTRLEAALLDLDSQILVFNDV